MKIATYNVNSIRLRLPVVLQWLKMHRPDVLCLQETKVQDADFPRDAFAGSGYHVTFRGMKSYNGVAVLSRKEPEAARFGFADTDLACPDPALAAAEEARLAHVVIGGLPIVNTYAPQGYLIESPKFAYKLDWYRRLREYFNRRFRPDQPVLWCGDLNVAPREIDVHSPEKHRDHVCFHADARRAYAETAAWGFQDVFVRLYPDRQQFTFWDYRKMPPPAGAASGAWISALEANKGWRIDHILATAPLAARARKADVDLDPRRAPQASDHTFLWAEFSD